MLYEKILRPLFFTLDPELMHHATHHFSVVMGKSRAFRAFLHKTFMVEDPCLSSLVSGVTFPNPVGLAAGFDKTGDMVGALSHVGFGYVEVGSVTSLPWGGNPKPRIFRLPKDEAIINRMGLNNPGAETAVETLRQFNSPIPIGISVAKTPDPEIMGDEGVEDFANGVMTVYGLADYLALNISCPNTAEGKTFEDPALLDALLTKIRRREIGVERIGTPIFVKISPDIGWHALDAVLEVCVQQRVNGLIIGNTTTSREGLITDMGRLEEIGRGGLSGRPLFERALSLVARVYRATGGSMPIMGCGGIFDADDAYRFIRAGASLVQIYTGMIFRGPWLMRDMNRGLVSKLAADGIVNIADAVGVDAVETARRYAGK